MFLKSLILICFLFINNVAAQSLSLKEVQDKVFDSKDIGDISSFLQKKGYEYVSLTKEDNGSKSVYFELSEENYIFVDTEKDENTQEDYVFSFTSCVKKETYVNMLKEADTYPKIEKFKNEISDNGFLKQYYINIDLGLKYVFTNGIRSEKSVYYVSIIRMLNRDYSEFLEVKTKTKN